MGFRKVRQSQELEIISLIDVIFLLIIFGIVFSVMRGAGTKLDPRQGGLFTIVFAREIKKPDDTKPPRMMVNIMNSDENNTVYSEVFPLDEVFMNMSPVEFEQEPACTLISSRLEFFADSLVAADPTKFIIVTAAPDTKLRIVNYVIKECSPYKDLFPWVKFGTK